MKTFSEYLNEAKELKLTKASYSRTKLHNQLSTSRGVFASRAKNDIIEYLEKKYPRADVDGSLFSSGSLYGAFLLRFNYGDNEKYYEEDVRDIKKNLDQIQKEVAKIIEKNCELEVGKDYEFSEPEIDERGINRLVLDYKLKPILSAQDDNNKRKLTREQRKEITEKLTKLFNEYREENDMTNVSLVSVSFSLDNFISIVQKPTRGLIDRTGQYNADNLAGGYAKKYVNISKKILKEYGLAVDEKAGVSYGLTTRIPVKTI